MQEMQLKLKLDLPQNLQNRIATSSQFESHYLV